MIITTMVFAVLTMFIYGSIKELRQTIQTKLFISYGASLVLPLFIVMVIIYEIFYPFLRPKDVVILDHITLYFGIASIIWSNVICYEMKRNARLMNHRHDLRAIWIRFFWYSLFVWCLSLALLLLNSFTVNRDPIYTDAFMVIFLSLNLIVFFLLTFQILKSNVQAAKLQCGNYNIIKNFRIVLRLAAMMGLSQITYYVAFAIGDNIDSVSGTKLIYIMGGVYMADAILVFLLFVLKRNVLNILKARYGCCCLIHNNNSVSGPTSSPSI
uniref:Uncharacterized protein n=1 Tax=Musca domestica TaxID=7370 RepID=A0A1I8MP34_MUSDO